MFLRERRLDPRGIVRRGFGRPFDGGRLATDSCNGLLVRGLLPARRILLRHVRMMRHTCAHVLEPSPLGPAPPPNRRDARRHRRIRARVGEPRRWRRPVGRRRQGRRDADHRARRVGPDHAALVPLVSGGLARRRQDLGGQLGHALDAGVNPENSFGSRRSVLAPELGRARVNPRARRACRRPRVENRAFARSTRVRSANRRFGRTDPRNAPSRTASSAAWTHTNSMASIHLQISPLRSPATSRGA